MCLSSKTINRDNTLHPTVLQNLSNMTLRDDPSGGLRKFVIWEICYLESSFYVENPLMLQLFKSCSS